MARDVGDLIDVDASECLNATDPRAWTSVLARGTLGEPAGALASDDDHELLIRLVFVVPVRARALVIRSPTTRADADVSGVGTVRVFVNGQAMGFENVARRKPAQTLEGAGEHALDATAFDRVRALTIFVESNDKGTARTVISEIRVFGDALASTDVAALKPC
ncbi:Galactose-binding domain-like [Ostreococcus tauri]|uniref:Galactose-binding domain-like n=1 Tax=Ostreococcus tauri TaxID=70448 RepID=A0A096P918_OSTTA|nr:Galactose-binding domain-like [Ostreococcus tauri]CEG00433.1 Galactose-binding domain-like [Ostreococcus tauri]|eukprot:XP_003083695.2 Galactose-binding domain-like [Ostreococcus tauri]